MPQTNNVSLHSNELKIENLVHRGNINSYLMASFEELIWNIGQSSDPKKDNYTLPRLDLEGHLSFDLIVIEKKIIAFSGLYNGGRYPEKVFRGLNRTYVRPDFRALNGPYRNWNSKHILPKQMDQFKNEIGFIFISREGLDGKGFLEKWTKSWAPDSGWQVSEDLVLVAPKSTESSGFQHIAYKEISPTPWLPKRLTRDAWKNIYEV